MQSESSFCTVAVLSFYNCDSHVDSLVMISDSVMSDVDPWRGRLKSSAYSDASGGDGAVSHIPMITF